MEIAPILVIIFNRSDFAERLYRILETVKPAKLYVISDGARNENEIIEVNKSREIFSETSWPCMVEYNYSDKNLGLRKRIASGIDWVFEKEDKLIILEDDCLPHFDFFSFCSEMLERYEHDERIMTVNGCNLSPKRTEDMSSSYFFSRYSNSWGWGTWKRSWQQYDSNLEGMDHDIVMKSFAYSLPSSKRSAIYWKYKLGLVKNQKINSWAYRWMFSLWINNGLAIVPKTNLIQNVGNDDRSSNTRGKLHYLNIDTKSLVEIKLEHPRYIYANYLYDQYLEDSIYSKSLKYRVSWLVQKFLP